MLRKMRAEIFVLPVESFLDLAVFAIFADVVSLNYDRRCWVCGRLDGRTRWQDCSATFSCGET